MCGAILGTVAGWDRAPDWSSDNRIYVSPGYIKYQVPPSRVAIKFRYRLELNITIYLCDSPALNNPIVVRKIEGVKIIRIWDDEYEGGFDKWITDVSEEEAEELVERSVIEVAGLMSCECDALEGKSYKITIISKEREVIS